MGFQRLYKRYPHLRQLTFGLRFPKRTAVVVGLLLVLGGLVWWGCKAGLKQTDWAAWVQAVGSIVAIFAAWRLGADQASKANDLAIRMHHYDHWMRVKAIFPIAAKAQELTDSLWSEPREDYYRDHYSKHAFDQCLKALDAVPLTELGSYGLVVGYLDLQGGFRRAAAAAYRRAPSDDIDYGWYEHEENEIEAAKKLIDGAVVLIRDNQNVLRAHFEPNVTL